MKPTKKLGTQKGFTLFEVVLAVSLLGLMSMAMAPAMKSFLTAKDSANRDAQYVINQKIANAMMAWSVAGGLDSTGTTSIMGTLPPPCTASPLYYGVTNNPTCNTGLIQYLWQQGVTTAQAMSDDSANKNLRVYQRLPALTQDVGLMSPSGPTVTLAYDFGVIYSTACGSGKACGSGSSKLVPANLLAVHTKLIAVFDTVNTSLQVPDPTYAPPSFSTSNTADQNAVAAFGVVFVSTLPFQKQMLQATATQLDRIRTAFKNYYLAKNSYPASGTVNLDPATNGGCWQEWRNLTDTGVTTDVPIPLLPLIGVGDPKLGFTPWGGTIEYCADYDPTVAGRTLKPDFAALRINSAVTQGIIPDSATDANNVFISF